ncbi:hypothetical protein K431DRAFT_138564 [Polychaeton citri CBS 116435]|uniref:Uncharacterized protein n=1 Tax=Polychaeton citri CBS 116435 TaxID=1314669 RepID=A0A9P4Q0F1_9PEZI|nr:hypothetical protein K431DRAFT_138564 [Polychaeton citri CBS 116435]
MYDPALRTIPQLAKDVATPGTAADRKSSTVVSGGRDDTVARLQDGNDLHQWPMFKLAKRDRQAFNFCPSALSPIAKCRSLCYLWVLTLSPPSGGLPLAPSLVRTEDERFPTRRYSGESGVEIGEVDTPPICITLGQVWRLRRTLATAAAATVHDNTCCSGSSRIVGIGLNHICDACLSSYRHAIWSVWLDGAVDEANCPGTV